MLKIDIKKAAASISVDSSNPFEPSAVLIDGSAEARRILEHRLGFAFGAFGHSFNVDSASPVDTHHAVFTSLADFDPVVVEGADLVEDYDPGIPEGAVT